MSTDGYLLYCESANKQQTSLGPSTSCLYTTQIFSVVLRVEQCGWVTVIGLVCINYQRKKYTPPFCPYLNVYNTLTFFNFHRVSGHRHRSQVK